MLNIIMFFFHFVHVSWKWIKLQLSWWTFLLFSNLLLYFQKQHEHSMNCILCCFNITQNTQDILKVHSPLSCLWLCTEISMTLLLNQELNKWYIKYNIILPLSFGVHTAVNIPSFNFKIVHKEMNTTMSLQMSISQLA